MDGKSLRVDNVFCVICSRRYHVLTYHVLTECKLTAQHYGKLLRRILLNDTLTLPTIFFAS